VTTPPETHRLHTDRGPTVSAISSGVVRLHAHYYGRGPTRAKTFLRDEYALTVLEDVFTTAERTLVRAGCADQVKAARAAFQEAMRDEFVAIVEEATGRRVRAFIGALHIEPELATELFLFEDGQEQDVIERDGEAGDHG
jgi:uncharacterized protein YbcI